MTKKMLKKLEAEGFLSTESFPPDKCISDSLVSFCASHKLSFIDLRPRLNGTRKSMLEEDSTQVKDPDYKTMEPIPLWKEKFLFDYEENTSFEAWTDYVGFL